MTDNDESTFNSAAVEHEQTFESDRDILLRQVASELRASGEKKKNPLKQLGTLALSLVLFLSFGLFSGSVSGILVLIGVIFIHEMGHLISMKLLKYKDVQMFFIPLFGAAVSGTTAAPSGLKKAVVSLMGPLPGILIGIVTGVLYFKTREPLLADATRTFLFINAFNLLPFHPLDGGRFFEAILFSRHPRLELIFKVITTLILGGIALILRAPILGFFTVVIFISLKSTYAAAKIAYEYKKQMNGPGFDPSDEIPDEHLRMLIPAVKAYIPSSNTTPKLIAAHISGIWQRVQNRPCSIGASFGMLLGYVATLLLGICSFYLFIWIAYAVDNRTVEIVTKARSDGRLVRVETLSIGTNKVYEIELDEHDIFHGEQTDWHLFTTKISKTGQWVNGFRDGTFLLYDLDGKLVEMIEYENGTPVRYRIISSGQTNEVPETDWNRQSKFFRPQEKPEKAEAIPLPEV